ncbi:MAG: type IV pilus assembly protein PilM [Proteobacteria bacterium]|nr:type IV pilus assembly protein PilM [Pseudomonadota bacterium]
MFYQKDLVAVDFGSSCIKVVALKKKGNKHILQSQPHIFSIPRGIINQGTIEKYDELVSEMKKVVSKSKLFSKTKRCALSIGGNAAIVRRVEIDYLDVNIPLGDQVRQLAEQQFSNFDELFWAYSEIDDPDNVGQKSVILCAAKIDCVERYVSIMRRVGFKVGVIDSSILCIANTFAYNCQKLPGLHMVLDLGATYSTVICFLNGIYCLSRVVGIGGDYYTACIASDLGMDEQRAENLKLSVGQGGSVSKNVAGVLHNVHELLAQEIIQTLDFFNKNHGLKTGVQSLQSVFMLGGSSMIPGLSQIISKKCGVQVNQLNPFYGVNMQVSKSIKKKVELQTAFYGVCFGLGIRQVDD